MKRLVLLVLLAPALANAGNTVGAITSGFMTFSYTDLGVNFTVAGSNFMADGNLNFTGDACCNPLQEISPVFPGQRWGFSPGYGAPYDVYIYGLDNLTYKSGDFTGEGGSGAADFGVGPVVINHPGIYFAPFTFEASEYGWPTNSPPGTTCATSPPVCRTEVIEGGGIATLNVVPFGPNFPDAFLVERATLNFVAEPGTASLMVLAIGGLFGWRRARHVLAIQP